ncbi:MAG: LptF/LptG family permease [Victivallales bacterium]|nr:LptF/LptG family permease [Victivallales bacterium]MCF7889420.1 LptF/LptG family permease [Victivallales bacterium]
MNENKNKTEYTYQSVPQKRLGILWKIDSYILKEFLVIYICIFFAFNMLFLVSNMVNSMGDLIQRKASFFQAGYYYMLKQPEALVFVFPITLLLACMYTMARMGLNNEITAMRASGISLFRCGFSIYMVGLVVVGIQFFFISGFASSCRREAENYIDNINKKNPTDSSHKMLMYRSPDNLRTWLVEDFVSNKLQKGVQIKRYNKKGMLIAELAAKKAMFKKGTGWIFYDTIYTKYKELKLEKNYSPETTGEKQEVIAPVEEKIKVVVPGSKVYKELGGISELPKDIFNSIKTPEELSSGAIMSILSRGKDLSSETVAVYKTLLYNRYAQPWICLFALFLGVPLAGSSERRGIMLSVITAILIIGAYLIIGQIMTVLGKKNYIPPFIAGAGPTLAFLAYIIYTVIKRQ